MSNSSKRTEEPVLNTKALILVSVIIAMLLASCLLFGQESQKRKTDRAYQASIAIRQKARVAHAQKLYGYQWLEFTVKDGQSIWRMMIVDGHWPDDQITPEEIEVVKNYPDNGVLRNELREYRDGDKVYIPIYSKR